MNVLFSICSPWKVGIDTFGIPSPGSWVDRVVVVHFNLDYSYPNMKNSDTLFPVKGRKEGGKIKRCSIFCQNPIDEIFERIQNPEGDADLQVCLLSSELRFESVVLQKWAKCCKFLRKGQVTGYWEGPE